MGWAPLAAKGKTCARAFMAIGALLGEQHWFRSRHFLPPYKRTALTHGRVFFMIRSRSSFGRMGAMLLQQKDLGAIPAGKHLPREIHTRFFPG
ncbi:hypothetical protein VTK26DRAFT_53 [Humicola hyalothermophila]